MFILALVSVTWVLVGYTLAFGKDFQRLGHHRRLGQHRSQGRRGRPRSLRQDDPASAFALFQMMFAIITPA